MLKITGAKRPIHDPNADVSSGAANPLRRRRATLYALLGASMFSAGIVTACGDDSDETTVNGGSGGSGGSGGAVGGSGGSGGGAVAGSSGSGGSGGGYVAPDRTAMATAICARFAELADVDAGAPSDASTDGGDAAAPVACSAPPDCVNGFVGQVEGLITSAPTCTEEIDAYFACIADEPLSSYACIAGVPQVPPGNNGCAAEEQAFFALFANNNACP